MKKPRRRAQVGGDLMDLADRLEGRDRLAKIRAEFAQRQSPPPIAAAGRFTEADEPEEAGNG